MSGAEIAGLVLGAIPLLVVGLEHYGEGIRTLNRLRKPEKHFLRLKQTLEVEHTILLNSLEILLRDACSESTIAELLADVNDASKWQDPELDRCLRQRLGRSYVIYFAAVAAMEKAVSEMRTSLRLSGTGQAPFSLNKHAISAMSKIKFGWNVKPYQEMMSIITSKNQQIHLLTTQSIALEPIRSSRQRMPDYELAREHATHLFSMLHVCLANCSVRHRASLCMQPIERGKQPMSSKDQVALRMILEHTSSNLSTQVWSMQEAEVRPCQALLAQTPAAATHAGRVHFQIPVPADQAIGPTHTQEIRDLCRLISMWRAAPLQFNTCLGYLADVTKTKRHEIHWPHDPMIDCQATSAVILASALQNQGCRLSLFDRRCVALAAAQGMLRLYDTPWLSKQWGRNELVLYLENGKPSTKHAFVTADFAGPKGKQAVYASQGAASYFRPCQFIREETIFALGVLLIELEWECPFETLKTQDDQRTGVDYSDFITADRLVNELYLRASHSYADAVRRCVRFEFDHYRNDLTDKELRKKVFHGVVAELQAEVDNLGPRAI